MKKTRILLQPRYQLKGETDPAYLEKKIHLLNSSGILVVDGEEGFVGLDVEVRTVGPAYTVITPIEEGQLSSLEIAVKNLLDIGELSLGYIRFRDEQVQFSLENKTGRRIDYKLNLNPQA